MALLVGFEDDAVAEVASRVNAQGSGSMLPKKWLQEHTDCGWVLGLLPVDGKVTYSCFCLKTLHCCLPAWLL